LRFIHHDILDSTMDAARRLAQTGDYGPVWISAGVQTQGRGRSGREWVSQKGNLYCSYLMPLNLEPAYAAQLGFVAGLAVADVLSSFVSSDIIKLKWPNDIMCSSAKIAGLLLEAGSSNGQAWLSTGVGINLISHPDPTLYTATHLFDHLSGAQLSDPEIIALHPQHIIPQLAQSFQLWETTLANDGFSAIRQAWAQRGYGLPGPVTARLPHETLSGEGLGLGENGQLRLRLDNGTIRDIHAGDVFFGAGHNVGES